MTQGFENSLRLREGKTGHVESYFWRANDPNSQRAFWLKATVLHSSENTSTLADAWCCTFDGNTHQMWGGRTRQNFSDSRFDGEPLRIEIGPCTFVLDPKNGWSQGRIVNDRGSCEWNLQWQPMKVPFAHPLELFHIVGCFGVGFHVQRPSRRFPR